MLDVSEYERLLERPEGSPAMLQNWRDLLFMHFSVEPEELVGLIPSGLTLDTYPDAYGQEMAWIGLVPFRVEGFRLPFTPPIPGVSNFPETNVRTYVHANCHNPGVWFFSLDAGKWVAAMAGKLTYHLPYYHAQMEVRDEANIFEYDSDRLEGPIARSSIRVRAGLAEYVSQPESLDYFLTERRILYSVYGGELYSAHIHHPRYLIGDAVLRKCNESLMKANKLPERDWEHTCFSPGVNVEAFPLRRVTETQGIPLRAGQAEML